MIEATSKQKWDEQSDLKEKDGASILVVEDHDDIAYGLKNNLEFDGHNVEIASQVMVLKVWRH